MADDIDIKDDHIPPRMRGYFPAMDIKEEPHEDDDDEYDSDTSGTINYEFMTSPNSATYFTNFEAHNNRIILGSKPPSKSLQPVLSDSKTSLEFDPKLKLKAVVCIDDWSERLANSPCYCGECETLFATRNALDAHNMLVHSYLVAMEAETPQNVPTPKGPLCRHCNNYFDDEGALIKHMYQIIEGKTGPEKAENRKGEVAEANEQAVNNNAIKAIASVAKRAVAVKRTGKAIDKSETVTKVAERTIDNTCAGNLLREMLRDKASETPTQKSRAIAVKHTANRSEPATNIPGNIKVQSEAALTKNEISSAFGKKELYYSCPVCSCVYKSKNMMKVHTKENHASIFDDYVLAPFQPGCKICNKNTVIQTHNTHVKNVHQKQFMKKVGYYSTPKPRDETLPISRKVTVVKPCPPDRDPLYNCIECNTTYVNYCSAMNHNRTYHPGKRESLIYIGPENLNPRIRGVPQYKKWMPKDVIFKCKDCPLHFLNSIVAILHSTKHNSADSLTKHKSDVWVCPKCNKTFRKTDQYNHEMQHDFNDEIRCYEYHKDIYSRVLCKCKCNVYLEERVFLKHYKYGCANIRSELCEKCNIHVKDYAVHRQRHKTLKADFILIHEFITRANVDGTDESALDDSTESMNQSAQNESDSQSTNQNAREKSNCDDNNRSTNDSILSENCSTPNLESSKTKRKSSDVGAKAKKAKLDSEPKYKMLYKCEACELFTDSYDSVVEHSQRHININTYKPDVRQCKICSMKFEDECLNDHKNSWRVKILPYKYEDLFKVSWLDFLSCMSKDKVDSITSSSKYVTLAVKMNMVLDGLPKLTMYKCVNCKKYVDPSHVFKHTHECDGVAGNFVCESCGILFNSTTGLENHEKIHEDTNITANSYRIVTFNGKQEKTFNLNLKRFYDNTRSYVDSEGEFERAQPDSAVSRSVTFYQCKKCKSCSESRELTTKHQCLEKSVMKKCSECDFVTSCDSLPNHMRWHSENKHMTPHDVEIVQFGDDSDKPREHMYFQCQKCNILLIHKQHECGKTVKEECTDCKYIFSKKGIRFHKQRHADDKNMTRNSITVVPFKDGVEVLHKDENKHLMRPDQEIVQMNGDDSPKPCEHLYFQCQVCNILLINKRHDCGKTVKEECPDCKYLFSRTGLRFHKQRHADDKYMTRDSITVVPFRGDEDVVNKEENKHLTPSDKEIGVVSEKPREHVYFQCQDCNVLFIHKQHDCGNMVVKKCLECEYIFSNRGLRFHMQRHADDNNMTRERITVVPFRVEEDNVNKDDTGSKSQTMYRCTSCKCLFITKIDFCSHYRRMQCFVNTGHKCAKCGLVFHIKGIHAHKEQQKNGICIPPNIVTLNKAGIKDYTLYKCEKCKIHFVNRATYRLHIKRGHNSARGLRCHDCDLRFGKGCFSLHVSMHHEKENYKTEDFNIVCPKLKNIGASDVTERTENEVRDLKERPETELSVRKSGRPRVPKKSFDDTENICNAIDNEPETVEMIKEYINRSQEIGSASNVTSDHTLVSNKVDSRKKNVANKIPGKKMTKLNAKDLNVMIKQMKHTKTRVNKYKEKTKKYEVKNRGTMRCIKKTHVSETSNSNNSVYKCVKCRLYYLSKTTVYAHVQNNHKTSEIVKCNKCGLKCTKNTLTRHKIIHHDTFEYTFKDLHIFEFTYSKSKSKVVMKNKKKEFPKKSTTSNNGVTQSDSDKMVNNNESDEESQSGDFVSILDKSGANKITITRKESASKNKKVVEQLDHEKETETKKRGVRNFVDFIDLEETLNSSTSSVVTVDDSDITETETVEQSNDVQNKQQINNNINTTPSKEQEVIDKNDEFKLFRCAVCNVYFIDNNSCKEHMLNHTPLDPYDYIECKLCTLQFQIEYLKKHIQIHHKKDFPLDKVLVDEFKPDNGEAICETYYAIDKVQSRLVSTTTDDQRDKRTEPVTANEVNADTEINVIRDRNSKESGNKSTTMTDKETREKSPFEIKKEIKQEIVEVSAISDNKDRASTSDLPNTVGPRVTCPKKLSPVTKHMCKFCTERFASKRAKELHESLDHLDALKDCPICKKSFNESILYELHLNVTDDQFTCCVCKCRSGTERMLKHIAFHNEHFSRYLFID